jgi:hypothetical protein
MMKTLRSILNENLKIKKTRTVMSLGLMLLLCAGMFAIVPLASAHDPAWSIPTYAYVTAAPDTVGVGQYTLIVMWLDKYPPTAGGLGGDLWRGFTVDITKPDGTTETFPYTGQTSQVGSAWMSYTPDQVGKYTIVFSWPGQVLTAGEGVPNTPGLEYIGDFFEGATSEPFELTVQQEQVTGWSEPAVPDDYWTRPIPTSNREWTQLTSNWLGGSWLRYSDFQESGTAPMSSHILWSRPILSGGIADERYKAVKFDTTDYENFFGDPIVMAGKIYYGAGTYPNYGTYCVDLKTGEVDWYKNGTDNGLDNPYSLSHGGGGGATGPNLAQFFLQPSFGQLYHYYSVNGEGIKNHLWMTSGSTWYMFDGNTGNWVLSLTHVPGGTTITDQDGSILRYSYNSRTGQFLCWNVSQSIPPPSPTGTGQQQWEPRVGAVIDAVNDTSWTEYGPSGPVGQTPWFEDDIYPRSGYTMNVTGPTDLPTSMNVLQDANYVPKQILLYYFSANTRFGSNEQTFEVALVNIDEHVAPYSPQPDKTFTQNNNLGFGVTLLWDKEYTYPQGGNKSWSMGPVSYEDRVFTLWCKETRQWYGYSLDDGSQIWGPTDPQPAWDMYGSGSRYAYGMLLSGYYSGILHAYNIKTGSLLWTYELNEIGYESPYGNYQITYGGIADGKIYIYSSEHSPTQPMWRGSYLRAIDASNGHEIWKSLNFVSGLAIADGCIVAGNNYDNQMYVYGKGPSATTVSATPGNGNAVTIQGTVTDQSPGAKGTAAISDANMDAWMDYLYMKQAMPMDAQGVPVTIYITDPNGNTQTLATVNCDMSGHFVASWTPSMEGAYTVTAAFDGSNSYGASSAVTGYAVGSGAAPVVSPTIPSTSAPSPSEGSDTTMYVIVSAAVVVIAVVAAAVLLRRRR